MGSPSYYIFSVGKMFIKIDLNDPKIKEIFEYMNIDKEYLGISDSLKSLSADVIVNNNLDTSKLDQNSKQIVEDYQYIDLGKFMDAFCGWKIYGYFYPKQCEILNYLSKREKKIIDIDGRYFSNVEDWNEWDRLRFDHTEAIKTINPKDVINYKDNDYVTYVWEFEDHRLFYLRFYNSTTRNIELGSYSMRYDGIELIDNNYDQYEEDLDKARDNEIVELVKDINNVKWYVYEITENGPTEGYWMHR